MCVCVCVWVCVGVGVHTQLYPVYLIHIIIVTVFFNFKQY